MRLLCAMVLLAGVIPAQLGRYELGRRLRLFEQAWEKVDDAERAHATPHLERAVRAFFGLNAPLAARSIEAARRAMAGDAASPASDVWADGLAFAPAVRLLDPQTGPLRITLSTLYEGEDDPPAGARVRCELLDKNDKVVAPAVGGPLADADAGLTLEVGALADGEYSLRGTVLDGERAVATARIGVSLASGLAAQLTTLGVVAANIPEDAMDPDATTLRFLLATLRTASEGKVAETDLPYARLLADAQTIARHRLTGNSFLATAPTGERWLCVAAERRRIALRLFAPPLRTPGQKLPLVVALHGAGGSENMFFDAYGAGKLIGKAYERDWIVVAPDNAGADVRTVIDEIARLYPVDRGKVFLIGHSMGAMAAIAAGAGPDAARYAAVVALGGGGRVPRAAKLAGRRFFVGVGARDFARAGALALRDALTATDAQVRFEEYPDVEHLTVVQRALPDVFAWLDGIASKR